MKLLRQLNEMNDRPTVFIPVSDMLSYNDYDMANGFGGGDQLDYDDGIVVRQERADEFRKHIAEFEREYGGDRG